MPYWFHSIDLTGWSLLVTVIGLCFFQTPAMYSLIVPAFSQLSLTEDSCHIPVYHSQKNSSDRWGLIAKKHRQRWDFICGKRFMKLLDVGQDNNSQFLSVLPESFSGFWSSGRLFFWFWQLTEMLTHSHVLVDINWLSGNWTQLDTVSCCRSRCYWTDHFRNSWQLLSLKIWLRQE